MGEEIEKFIGQNSNVKTASMVKNLEKLEGCRDMAEEKVQRQNNTAATTWDSVHHHAKRTKHFKDVSIKVCGVEMQVLDFERNSRDPSSSDRGDV